MFFTKNSTEYSFLDDFLKYCKAVGYQNKVDVTVELLIAFSVHWFSEYQRSEDFLRKKKELDRKWYLKNRLAEFEACSSAVYCIEFDEIVDSISMGKHWSIVTKFVERKFGKHPSLQEERFDEFDKWIKENIRITGCFNHSSGYTFENHRY